MLFTAILFFMLFIGMPIIWNCSNYKIDQIENIELNYRIIEHTFYKLCIISQYTVQYSSKYQVKKKTKKTITNCHHPLRFNDVKDAASQ